VRAQLGEQAGVERRRVGGGKVGPHVRRVRMPGITTLTAGCASTNRSASSGSVIPSGTSFCTASTRSTVGPRFSGPK
jgi:hypothetical protein